MIVKADLELTKDAFSAKEIEANSKTFGESDGRCNLKFPNAEFEIMDIGRDEASVANHNHLLPTPLPVYSNALCIIYMLKIV